MEIADVFAVNKADREGADRTVRDLQGMLELRRITQPLPPDHDPHHHLVLGAPIAAAPTGHQLQAASAWWEPPIVKTVAATGEGVDDLVAALQSHHDHLATSGQRAVRDTARARAGFVAILRERLLAGALGRLEAEVGRLDEVAARIAARQADPYQLAEELAARLRA